MILHVLPTAVKKNPVASNRGALAIVGAILADFKYVLVAIVVPVLISTVKGMFEKEPEVVPVAPHPPSSESRSFTIKSNAFEASASTINHKVLISILVGGLGMMAGSLSMVQENSGNGLLKSSITAKRRRSEYPLAASVVLWIHPGFQEKVSIRLIPRTREMPD